MACTLTIASFQERLIDLFIQRGTPDYIRSNNGPEFTAHRVWDWLDRVGVETPFIEPGSPWENGFLEKLCDELLDTLPEARVLIEH